MIEFLRCVAEAAAEKGIKGLAEMVPGGAYAYDVAEGAWKKHKDRKKDAEAREEIRQLAQTNFEEAKRAAVEAARGVAADPEDVILLELYLSQVPAAVRQSLKRAEDPTGTSLPPTFTLRSPADVLGLLPPRPARFRPGDPLPARPGWVLDRPLGAGGFGEVWLVRHPRMASLAGAVKFFHGRQARDVRHEGGLIDRVVQYVRHPGVVPLRDVHLDGDPCWLMYEYVPGGDLADVVRELAGRPPAERVTRAAAALRELAAAVGVCHRLVPPVVHRDLKPSNVLLDPADGRPRVTDFGIGAAAARECLGAEALGSVTQAGRLLSYLRGSHTPLYASPQQRAGADPDPRDDVHALGVIGYQLVTGRLDQGAGPDFAEDLREGGAGEDLVALLGRCVSQKAERRPADAAELADRLAALSAPPQPPPGPGREPPPRPVPADRPPAGQGIPAGPAGGPDKPGIIASIIEFLRAASEQHPISKKVILERLRARFPDRDPAAMRNTVNAQVPSQLRTEKGVVVQKNANGYWISPEAWAARRAAGGRAAPATGPALTVAGQYTFRAGSSATEDEDDPAAEAINTAPRRYPTWGPTTPRTDPRAAVRRTRRADGVRAVRVEGGGYRGALVSGTFELEDQVSPDPVETTPAGKRRVRVVCAWHGVTPRNSYPHLDVTDGRYTILSGYSGEVADDIA